MNNHLSYNLPVELVPLQVLLVLHLELELLEQIAQVFDVDLKSWKKFG